MRKKILIVGGYGSVGRVIATHLCEQYPDQVVVAGRSYKKAQAFAAELNHKVMPLELDISATVSEDQFLHDVGTVIMCIDQGNQDFVRSCIQRAITYIDISASYTVLSKIEALDQEARSAGSTVVLSVGLAPGMTNLLTKLCQTKRPDMAIADIYIMLGLGDAHGEAAIRWTLDNIDAEFSITEKGESKRVASFEDGKQTTFPGGVGLRTAYRFNLSDQHVLPRTLGLQSVSTRLCFDSSAVTRLFAALKKTGATNLLKIPRVQELLVGAMKRFQFGSETFILKVEARDAIDEAILYECTLAGEVEARGTGLVAAKVAEELARSPTPPGVFHMEQLFDPLEFLNSLGGYGLQFREQVYSRLKSRNQIKNISSRH